MRFAILHCRHCAQHIWVPEKQLGLSGKCPLCGAPIFTPAAVPPDVLVEGPPVMEVSEETERGLTRARA